MRKTIRARSHWITPGGFALPATCFGLLFFFGCTSNPAPAEEALATASVPEEVAIEGETPEAAMDAGVDGAAEVSSAARYAGENRSVSGKISDASLAAKVQLALVDARDLRAHRFEPEAIAGRVTLRGHVHTWAQRERAAEVAASVPGVASVSNEITSTEEKPTDIAGTSGRPGSASGGASGGGNGSFAAGASPGGGAEGSLYHTVARGENLWSISRKYGVSIDRIKSMNGLTDDAIRSGQRLRIR